MGIFLAETKKSAEDAASEEEGNSLVAEAYRVDEESYEGA